MRVDEMIQHFRIYEDGYEYVGAADVTLPTISNLTTQVQGAGIPGSYNSIAKGHLEPMSMTLSFRTITDNAMRLMEQRTHKIELHTVQQYRDSTDADMIETGAKHILRVQPQSLNAGKVAVASSMDASGEYSVFYWAFWESGEKKLEIDIMNFIYVVNGIDWLADTRKMLGMT